MANVTCKICKNKIDKENAYKVEKVSAKTNKIRNEYYCNKQEYENDLRNKQLYKEIQYITDIIIGYPIKNTNRNKEITKLQEAGFTNEEIFRCFKYYKDEIIYYMGLKDDMKEGQKIKYMFTVVGNNIVDHKKEDKERNDWEKYKKETVEEIEEIIEVEETSITDDFKVKKRKKLF